MKRETVSIKATLALCLVVLVAATAITTLIFSTEPKAQRTGAVRETAMLADVLDVRRGDYHPRIVATGVIEASEDIVLSPRVAGEIVERSSAFAPGGSVRAGEMLLRIDPADYENSLAELAQRLSELHQAEANLQMELGRQNVARQDYALLDAELSEEQEALVLREPQLNAARAQVEAAQAAVAQAKLALERTRITAPFEAHVVRRSANLGSQVAPGDDLGHLVGIDTYWVAVTVPLAQLRWLEIPSETGSEGSRVIIRNRTAWDPGQTREGRLFRLVGALEDETRMARVLAEIPEPLGGGPDRPPLIIGSFVEVEIEGRQLENVVKIERDYVRTNDTVWLMEDGKLVTREADIVFRDATHAYVRAGLQDGDQVVITNLSTVRDGAPLRLQ